MAVRKLKPVTPGQRHKVIGTFEDITASVPEKTQGYWHVRGYYCIRAREVSRIRKTRYWWSKQHR